MVYLSLIHGADGIGYYSYNYVSGKKDTNVAKEQPALWAAVKQINAEVKQIGEFLFDAKPDSTVNLEGSDPSVEFRAWDAKGKRILLLANTSNGPQNVRLKFATLAEGNLQRLDHAKVVPVMGFVGKVTLAPCEAVGLQY
jgi:hypothetical protein